MLRVLLQKNNNKNKLFKRFLKRQYTKPKIKILQTKNEKMVPKNA